MFLRLDNAYYDLGRLDLLAENNSPIHRLDPRAKVLITLIFIIYVVSFGKYEITRLLPFFLYPAFLIGIANVPFGFLLRKLIIVSPSTFGREEVASHFIFAGAIPAHEKIGTGFIIPLVNSRESTFIFLRSVPSKSKSGFT